VIPALLLLILGVLSVSYFYANKILWYTMELGEGIRRISVKESFCSKRQESCWIITGNNKF
jgi:hypothetical protein